MPDEGPWMVASVDGVELDDGVWNEVSSALRASEQAFWHRKTGTSGRLARDSGCSNCVRPKGFEPPTF